MLKRTAFVLAAAIAAGSAFAQQLSPSSPDMPVGASIEAKGSELVSESTGGLPLLGKTVEIFDSEPTAPECSSKNPRRPRKEYPNVMGMSLSAWLVSRPQ